MSKKSSDDYEKGYQDGRAGFMRSSHGNNYEQGYLYGLQEYEYWNRPSTEEEPTHNNTTASDEFGFGTIITTILLWLIIWFPAALIFGPDSPIFNAIFWGGLIFIVLLFLLWLLNAISDASSVKKK